MARTEEAHEVVQDRGHAALAHEVEHLVARPEVDLLCRLPTAACRSCGRLARGCRLLDRSLGGRRDLLGDGTLQDDVSCPRAARELGSIIAINWRGGSVALLTVPV